MAEKNDFDVAVIGAGPVGLVAALSLAQHGKSVCLLEATDGPCSGSRAINISRRSQQILAALGIGDALLARGLPFHQARSYLGQTEIFHLHMPSSDSDRFPPFMNLQQFLLEEMLLAAVAAQPGIELNCRASAELSGHDGRGVDIGWQLADGSHRQIRAGWCVAADGAHSGLRRQLGLQLKGDAYQKTYLIADIRMQTDLPVERRVWFDPDTNPGSTVILHRQPDDILRIDYQLGLDEDPQAELADDRVLARLQAHLDYIGYGDRPWELVWKSLYNARALSLDCYHHGRILFAGDAAHLVPIFGVRGMNSGIDDAFNLGWKLAAVASGASLDLLASYTEERRTAFAENIAAARMSTFFMSPPGPGTALMRDAALELACTQPAFRVLVNPRQSSAHCYRSSFIMAPENQAGGPNQSAAGWPLPDLPLPAGGTLNDQLGPCFALIEFGDQGLADLSGYPFAIQHFILPADSRAAEICGASTGDWLLLRPDHHIMARGNQDRTRLTAALDFCAAKLDQQPPEAAQ